MIDERNEEATEQQRLAARITGEVREHLLVSLAAVKKWRRYSVLFIGDLKLLLFFSRRTYLHIDITITI